MALRGWSWDAAGGPAGLGDRPLLEALRAALPDELVEAAIEATGTRERRRRRLPTQLVVTLVVAMGLWASESIRHSLAAVVDGWREGADASASGWQLPSTAAMVRARRRAGARLLRVLFQAVAGPIAAQHTPGACLHGLRLLALDGTTLDVADTPANVRAFGRPHSPRGTSGYPQLRVVALIETGTHALCDVVLRPCRAGETAAGRRLLRSVGPGQLLLWDRNFHSFEMVRATQVRGARCLGRAKTNLIFEPTELLADGSFLARLYPSPKARRRDRDGLAVRVIEYALDTPAGPGQEKYRLVTSLLDERASPAEQLARTYHERWEIETTLAELKVHQWAHPRPLRSQQPREVVQEVYGLLLAHLAIRTLMHQAAVRDGLDPDRLSFTGALRVLRRAIPRAQRTQPDRFPFFAPAS
jgi:Insertion element 4 transposase N-terminal/Transposase DDE domain